MAVFNEGNNDWVVKEGYLYVSRVGEEVISTFRAVCGSRMNTRGGVNQNVATDIDRVFDDRHYGNVICPYIFRRFVNGGDDAFPADLVDDFVRCDGVARTVCLGCVLILVDQAYYVRRDSYFGDVYHWSTDSAGFEFSSGCVVSYMDCERASNDFFAIKGGLTSTVFV